MNDFRSVALSEIVESRLEKQWKRQYDEDSFHFKTKTHQCKFSLAGRFHYSVKSALSAAGNATSPLIWGVSNLGQSTPLKTMFKPRLHFIIFSQRLVVSRHFSLDICIKSRNAQHFWCSQRFRLDTDRLCRPIGVLQYQESYREQTAPYAFESLSQMSNSDRSAPCRF